MDFVTLIPAILSLIQQLGPGVISTTGTVGKVLDVVVPLVPVVIKEFKDLMPTLRNIITGLKAANPSDDDWARLMALEEQIDAAFEAAASKT